MAQLIEAKPLLAGQQRALKAILLASAWKKLTDFTGVSGCDWLDNKQGVGMVDAKNARYTINNNFYTQALLQASSFPYTKTAYFSSSASSARVALVWLKRNKLSGEHGELDSEPTFSEAPAISNLDLEVYAPNGTLVASSAITRGNVEVVEFNPTVSGYYTIKVKRVSGVTSQDAIALAWW